MDILISYILLVCIFVLWNFLTKNSIKNLFVSFLNNKKQIYLKKCQQTSEKEKINEIYLITTKILRSFSLNELEYLLKVIPKEEKNNSHFNQDSMQNGISLSHTVREYQETSIRTLFACLNLCTIKGFFFSTLFIFKGMLEYIWNSIKGEKEISLIQILAQPMLVIWFISSASLMTRDFEHPQKIFNDLTSSADGGSTILRLKMTKA